MKEVIFLKTVTEVEDFIQKQNFTKENWRWVGDQENNEIQWNRNQFPQSAIIEVVTNAMDAVKQKLASSLDQNDLSKMNNPRDLTEYLFGYRNLDRKNIHSLYEIADKVQVWIEDSGNKNKPSISVRDRGIGIHGSDFSSTICSFGNSNKEHKSFLIGRYGIGGSTTLSFCEYRVIISRPVGSSKSYYTIQKQVFEKDENGREQLGYKYLVDSETQEPFSFYTTDSEFQEGTLVKQIQYEFTGKTGSPRQYENNSIRRVFETGLFDPILPYRIYGYRKGDWDKTKRIIEGEVTGDRKSKDEYGRTCHKAIMMGNKSQLIAQYNRNDVVDYMNTVNKKIKTDSGEIEFKLTYYILDDNREKMKGDYYFPSENRNVIHLRDGQMHGYSLGFDIFRHLDFEHDFIKNDMLFAIEYLKLNKKDSSILLMPNREQVRSKGDLFKNIIKTICGHLTVDRELRKINEKRKQEALKNVKEDPELREMLKELLKKGDIKANGKGLKEMDPIEMKEVPSYIKILTNKDTKFNIGSKVRLLFATDGPVGVDDFISGQSHYEGYDFETITDFKNGYGIAVFKANENSKDPISFSVQLDLVWPESKIKLMDTFVVNIVEKKSVERDNYSSDSRSKGGHDPQWMIINKDDREYERYFPEDHEEVTGFNRAGICYLNGENRFYKNLLLKCKDDKQREKAESNYLLKVLPLLISGGNDYQKRKDYLNGVDPSDLQRDFTYHISKSSAASVMVEMSL